MKLVHYGFALSLFLIAFQAVAQECYLASECEGGETCVNRQCVMPEAAPISCGSDADCSYDEACLNGFCKLEAVACASETGEGYVGVSSAEFECGNGMGEGWAGAMDCSSSEEGGDVCIVRPAWRPCVVTRCRCPQMNAVRNLLEFALTGPFTLRNCNLCAGKTGVLWKGANQQTAL